MLGKLAFALAAALLIGVAAGYGDDRHAVLAVAADFRLHLGLLGAALGLVAGILSLRRAAVLAFLATLGAALGLGPVYDPAADAGALRGSSRSVTLLYANLWDENPEPDRLRAALRAANADILITSETTGRLAGGADGLRAQYRYRIAGMAGGATLRTAIWSKFPLRRGGLFLNNTESPTGAAAIAVLGRGFSLSLIGVHFSRAGEGLRQVQADALGPIAGGLSRPLVVAGDFNAAPWSWVVSRAAEVTGTRVVGGHRITWKGNYPTPFGPVPAPWGHQIDHVLVSEGIGIEEISTVLLPGSDHRGLRVRLRVVAQ